MVAAATPLLCPRHFRTTQVVYRWHLMENASHAVVDGSSRSMRQVRGAVGFAAIPPVPTQYFTRTTSEAASSVYANRRSWFFSGNDRIRRPVAAKIAFNTAGAATKMVGSPTPPQNPPEGTKTHSTFGMLAIRIES